MSLHQSSSQNRISRNPQRMDRSPSQRVFYINDEVINSKDISTTFHSPYKDGKRNNEFMNPTFASSDIFYAQDKVRNSLIPRHNLIQNKNQREKKQLYNKRMQKQDFITNSVHETAAHDILNRQKNHKVSDQSQPREALGRSMSSFRNNKDDRLKNQLQVLIRFRENDQRKQASVSRRLNTTAQFGRSSYQNETPIFHQKNRDQIQQKTTVQNRKNLKDWIAISDKIKRTKNTADNEVKKKEEMAMDHFIEQNKNRNLIKEQQSRKNVSMLANILRQQIKQSEAKKIRQKKEKDSLN